MCKTVVLSPAAREGSFAAPGLVATLFYCVAVELIQPRAGELLCANHLNGESHIRAVGNDGEALV